MRMSFLLIFLVASVAIASKSWAHFSNCRETTDHYILIHGIGGSKSSFGEMKNLIPKHLKCSQAHYFEYDTKNSALTVNDFSRQLDQQLRSLPNNHSNIHFVMHSQGGLIGLNWIISAINHKKGFSLKPLKRLKKFISFSTPFAGSDFALMGERFFFSLGLDANQLSRFGKKQLIDMKYGSHFIQSQFRELFENDKLTRFLREKVQVLNIVGVSPQAHFFVENFNISNSQFFEGDFVVNTPSMKMSYLYNNILLKNGESETSHSSMIDLNFGEQRYIKGLHVGVRTSKSLYGVVNVPKSCLDLTTCDHQGYLEFIKFTAPSKNLTSDIQNDFELSGFELHVNVKIKDSQLTDLDLTRLNIENYKDQDIDLSLYRLQKNSVKAVSINHNNLYFVIKGSLIGDKASGKLRFNLYHPNLHLPPVEVEVQKDRLSYSQLTVE